VEHIACVDAWGMGTHARTHVQAIFVSDKLGAAFRHTRRHDDECDGDTIKPAPRRLLHLSLHASNRTLWTRLIIVLTE